MRKFYVISMMRSGHHAIIEWILSHFGPSTLFNNFPFKEEYKYNESNPGEPCKIINFEDFTIEEAKENIKSLGWTDAQPIIILRDPYNLFASRRRASFETRREKVGEETKELWLNHAREFIRDTQSLHNPIMISFNSWFQDALYREFIATKFNVPFIVDRSARISTFGYGSSFKKSNPTENAYELNVLERWRELQCPHYKKIAYDTEVVKMADRIFTTPGLPRHKIVYTMDIGNYMPELCKITIPTIEAYANKIGAEFQIIAERKFPEWPVTYEKMQLYELAERSEWTIFIDADTVIRPEMPDITEGLRYREIAVHIAYDADTTLPSDYYMIEDRRNVGVATSFIVSPRFRRNLWKPFNEGIKNILRRLHAVKARPHIADEYCVSRNLARYGIPFKGIATQCKKHLLHLSATIEDDNTIQRAKQFLENSPVNSS
jgi:hypothetical protein